jgi:hypothetical protein
VLVEMQTFPHPDGPVVSRALDQKIPHTYRHRGEWRRMGKGIFRPLTFMLQ